MNKKFDFVKAIYFVAFGIVFTVVLTLLQIVPHLKEYRDTTRYTQRQETQIEELEKKQEELKTQSEKLKKEYANGFDVLHHGFSQEALMKHVPKGCELSVGASTGEEVDGKFKKVSYDAIMIVSNPAEYYKFVELATQEGTLCSLDKGMTMQSIEGDKLKIGFIITAYVYAHDEKKEDKKSKEHSKEKKDHPHEAAH